MIDIWILKTIKAACYRMSELFLENQTREKYTKILRKIKRVKNLAIIYMLHAIIMTAFALQCINRHISTFLLT
jgi:hypothetical protein